MGHARFTTFVSLAWKSSYFGRFPTLSSEVEIRKLLCIDITMEKYLIFKRRLRTSHIILIWTSFYGTR